MPVTEEKSKATEPPALLKIPAFPPIAIRLLHLVSDENVAISEVLDLLRVDPAFSAEILRRANSALYGFSSQISSLQHALVVLGLRRVKVLTMTVATGVYLKKALEIGELRRCWRHTLACALLTEELARACSIHVDLAYTAGLLHDVGRLGLLVAHPHQYSDFLQAAGEKVAAEDSFDLLDYEQQVFGIDHCAAGNWLVGQWNLPQEFKLITGRHHDHPDGADFDLLALVHLGCQLASTLGFYVVNTNRFSSFEQIREALPQPAQHRFHPNADELRELVEEKINANDIEEMAIPPAAPEPASAPSPLPQAEAPPGPPPPGLVPEPEPAQPELLALAALPRKSTLKRDVVTALVTVVLATAGFLALFRLLSE